MAAKDDCFLLDGFLIIPMGNSISADFSKDKYNEILHKENITNNIYIPQLELDSYVSIFEHFKNNNVAISMDTVRGFYLGKVSYVEKDSISFLYFDANGEKCTESIWYECSVTIDVKQKSNSSGIIELSKKNKLYERT